MHAIAKRRLVRTIVAVALAAALGFPLSAAADDHDPQRSGHPLEVIGTLLYPVGWLVDTVVLRPLHWLANHEPVATITGHEADEGSDSD